MASGVRWRSRGHDQLRDIFSTKAGAIDDADPIDVEADAIISPANSFGFMDGGIDAVNTYPFGEGLPARLQARIAEEHRGELPVGMAVIIPTMHPDVPWCTVNACLASRAAVRAVVDYNARALPPIRRVLCPGLATAVGKMPVARCARQMRAAWDRVLGDRPARHPTLRAAADEELALLR